MNATIADAIGFVNSNRQFTFCYPKSTLPFVKTDTPRTAKLRALVTEAGGAAAFARKYSRQDADKPIDETYISQILTHHRAFGEKAARNMEMRAGLPPGYFDDYTLPPDAEQVARDWLDLEESLREHYKAVFHSAAERARSMGPPATDAHVSETIKPAPNANRAGIAKRGRQFRENGGD